MNSSQRNASTKVTASATLKLQDRILGNAGRVSVRATLLLVALGFTATVVASPPAPKAGNTASTSSIKHHHWFEIGEASWYGRHFQGRKTASGEPFNMNDLTCAHRTLPLGSWVRVTNLSNSKSVLLRVNDRGPVPEARIIDLSYAAARKLDINGVGDVRIDKVNPNNPQIAQEVMASLQPADTITASLR